MPCHVSVCKHCRNNKAHTHVSDQGVQTSPLPAPPTQKPQAGASDTGPASHTPLRVRRSHLNPLPLSPSTQTNAVLGRDPATGNLRGLYATSFIPQHGTILSIPYSTILNVGGHTDFGGPTLHLLRELHNPGTRFRPYFDSLPAAGQAVSGCNLPPSYIPMLQSPFWVSG